MSPVTSPTSNAPKSNLFDRAVILSVTLRRPGTRRKASTSLIDVISPAADEMLSTPNVQPMFTTTDKSLLHLSKDILDSDELRAVQRLDGTIREYLSRTGLPSPLKQGCYLIPIDLIEASCLHLRRHSKRFPTVAHIREQADLLPKVKPISSGYHQAHPNDPPFCNRCDDCGWELHSWCENGQCGDHRPHIAHPFTCPCACRSSNPIYREKLKHGAFHKDVD